MISLVFGKNVFANKGEWDEDSPWYVLVRQNRAGNSRKGRRIPSINSPFGKPHRLVTPGFLAI